MQPSFLCVLANTLLNLYTQDIPTSINSNSHVLSCADDLTIVTLHTKYKTAAGQIETYIHRFEIEYHKQTTGLHWQIYTHTNDTLNRKYNGQPRVILNNVQICIRPIPQNTIFSRSLEYAICRGRKYKQRTDKIQSTSVDFVIIYPFPFNIYVLIIGP